MIEEKRGLLCEMALTVAALRAALAQHANATRAAQTAKYFAAYPGLLFYGLSGPEVDAVVKAAIAATPPQSAPALLAAATELMAERHMEMKRCAYVLLDRRMKAELLPTAAAATFTSVERMFDAGHVFDWATCDSLACRVLAAVVRREPALATRLQAWPRGSDPWKARAACVAFVKLGDPALGFVDGALTNCDATLTVHGNVRIAQLGVGWALKELGVKNADAVDAFIRAHHAQLSSAALRAAVEKRAPGVRAQLLASGEGEGGVAASAASSSASKKRRRGDTLSDEVGRFLFKVGGIAI